MVSITDLNKYFNSDAFVQVMIMAQDLTLSRFLLV